MVRILFFLICLVPLIAGSATLPPEPSLKAGDMAPPFMLKNLEGQFTSLRDFCGNLRNPWKNKTKYNVAVNFWATYCKPCKIEIPLLEKLSARHGDKVKVLLVSIDKEGQEFVQSHVAEKGYKCTVLLDPYQRTAQKYGVKAVPALFLVDREGKIQYAHYGYDKQKGIRPLVDRLKILEGVKPSKPKKAKPSKPKAGN